MVLLGQREFQAQPAHRAQPEQLDKPDLLDSLETKAALVTVVRLDLLGLQDLMDNKVSQGLPEQQDKLGRLEPAVPLVPPDLAVQLVLLVRRVPLDNRVRMDQKDLQVILVQLDHKDQWDQRDQPEPVAIWVQQAVLDSKELKVPLEAADLQGKWVPPDNPDSPVSQAIPVTPGQQDFPDRWGLLVQLGPPDQQEVRVSRVLQVQRVAREQPAQQEILAYLEQLARRV